MTQTQLLPQRAPDKGLLATIFLLTLMEFLQAGMIAFAAGPIMGKIGASPEEFGISTVVYACVAICVIAKQRWLVERLGWRDFVLLSLAVFILGSAICAMSDSYLLFLMGRVVMGLGGAAFMTTGRVIVNLIPPGPERFVGIKYFATGLCVGIAFAPALGSYAVFHDHWHGIFWILIAAAIAAMFSAALSLSTDRVPARLRSQSHPMLFVSLIGGSFLLLYALQRSQYDFFVDATVLAAAIACGLLALFYFVRALGRHELPLLDLKVLRQPRYIAGVAIFTLCYVLLGANNLMVPILMQRSLGYPWESVGNIQSLGLLAAIVSWMFMSWTLPRWPAPKKFLVTGFMALAVFGLQLSRINDGVSLWPSVYLALACNGIFLMFVLGTTAMQTFRDVQYQESVLSHAQQVKNMTAQLGTALGIAMSALMLQWRSTEHYSVLNGRFTASDPIYLQVLHELSEMLASRGAGSQSDRMATAYLARILEQQATLLACIDYFSLVALIGALGALVMLLQRWMK